MRDLFVESLDRIDGENIVTQIFLFVACAILLLSGCVGGPDIPITSGELHGLNAEREIRLLYYPSSTIDNFVIPSCLGGGRYNKCPPQRAHPPVLFEDPLSAIQAQVTDTLREKLGLNNIQTVRRDEPLSQHPLPLDEQSLGRGVVFKFDTRYWHVKRRFLSYTPRPGTTLPVSYNLRYSAEGRLFRDGESKLLWKASCKVDLPFEASGDIRLEELINDENSIIHWKRREAGVSCAEQLLEKFFLK